MRNFADETNLNNLTSPVMRKTLLSLFSLFMLATTVLAQGVAFRRHRYDGFKTHKVTNENIVFLGNSITNMHEWWEAFGNAKILNRGVNGAESPIMLEHLEATLMGHPAKIFFMMGTNDLGTNGMNSPAFVAKSVRTALKRCQKESPTTKVYFQSILPCTTNGVKDIKHIPIANDSIKKLCEEYGATYIDLYNDLKGIENGTVSYDGTHLTMEGYRIWCKKIAEHVGSSCVYPDDAKDENGTNGGIAGMRTTYFSALPVKANDIIIIGDDGNDWHELLNSDHVKQRGGSWGYQSNEIDILKKMVPCIFKGRSDNEAPKMVCLVAGYRELNNNTDLSTIETNYKALVELIRQNAPTTAIRLMAVIPTTDANKNSSRISVFNEKIKAMAESMENVEYCDASYTMLVENGVIKSAYYGNGYMTGLGYAKLSQAMAKAIGEDEGVTATTDEEASSRIATFNTRNTLVTAINKAEAFPIGTKVGQYKKEDVTPLTNAIEEGYQLLADATTTNEALTAQGKKYTNLLNDALSKIIMPTVSTNDDEHWYQLYTPNRESKYTTSKGDGKELVGGDNTKYANTMWKFVERNDGSWDIVNRDDKTYINPASAYDTAIKTTATQPANGWKLSYANATGTFIISSGNVQLNQTGKNNSNYKIYNWSTNNTGTDRNDAGCQFAIVDAPEVVVPEAPFLIGEVAISMSTGNLDGGTMNNSNYGKKWTSKRTQPQVTLSSNANNIWNDANSQTLRLHIAGNGPTTHTLKVSEGYEITGISAKVKHINASSNVTINVNGTTLKCSNEEQLLQVTDLANNSVDIVLTGSGAAYFDEFVVNIRKEGYDPFIKGNVEIAMNTGTMDGGTADGIRYGKVWTSTRTEPQLKLFHANKNNFWVDKDNNSLILLTGAATSVDFTLSVSEGYEITNVRMLGTSYAPNVGDLEVKIGNQSQTLSGAEEQLLEFGGFKAQNLQLTISGNENKNKGVIARQFMVSIQKEGSTETNIVAIAPATNNQPSVIYDLSGRRVNHATKGVFIINGKKVIK